MAFKTTAGVFFFFFCNDKVFILMQWIIKFERKRSMRYYQRKSDQETCRDSNPGPLACRANALPVAYLGQGLGGLRMENPAGGLGGALWAPQRGPGQRPEKFWKYCILRPKLMEFDAILLCVLWSVFTSLCVHICINISWWLCWCI